MFKENIIDSKLIEFYEFKMKDDECYFAFIKSYTVIEKILEDGEYSILFNIIENLANTLTISNDKINNYLLAVFLLKNLHILYLYFSNYPYLLGALSDEEIFQILSEFKPDILESDLEIALTNGYNSLVEIVDNLAKKVDKGI